MKEIVSFQNRGNVWMCCSGDKCA